MNKEGQGSRPEASPFFCYAVPIAPEEGASRQAFMRLEELAGRNRWFVRLRWAAMAALALVITLSRYVFGLPLSTGVLYWATAAGFLYNAAFYAAGRKRKFSGDVEKGLQRAKLLARSQIVADLVLLTVVIHFSGGVENPFFHYFVFHMVIASILLARPAGFWIATLAVGLFSAVVVGEYLSLFQHHPLWHFPMEFHKDPTYVLAVLFVFVTTMYLAVYLADDITVKLRDRGRELVSVTTSLERGTLELQETYQRIKALEEKKSEGLRMASHQLRGPLAAIRSLLDVILDGYAGDAEKERELLGRIRGRTDGMLALINDVLVLSALKDGQKAEEKSGEVMDICTVLRELAALYRPKAEIRGLKMRFSPPPPTCAIFANAAEIHAALNNLLDNAISYTPAGGVVKCGAKFAESKVVITIRDSGIGIAEGEIDRVFDEFYRAPGARKANEGGTGLGLAIAKRAVEKWGGTISLRSTLGEGTEFTLAFPAASPTSEPTPS